MTSEIRTLADDEVISEPGFYQISLERHHGQPCDGPSVTSGVLRKMETGFPAEVWAFHKLNPDRIEDTDTAAKRMGRAMAAYIEGGADEIERHFMVLPDNRPQRPTRQQLEAIKEGRGSRTAHRSVAFWREVDTDPRDQITEAQFQTIQDMGIALVKDPAATAALGGIPEITMAWQDEATGLWCLARPDNLSFSGILSDYKKISPRGGVFNERLCDRAIDKYRYDMQMGFASEGFERLIGSAPDAVGLVFQSDEKPHFCILREIPEEDLAFGRFHNHRSLVRFAECLKSGHWPEPGENIGPYRRSDSDRERILNEMNTEGVAP